MCPACVTRALELRLDKKQRPYFSCCNCNTRMFVKLGTIGVGNFMASMSLLDQDELASHVRRQGVFASEAIMNGAVREVLQQSAVTPYAISGVGIPEHRKVANG